MVIVSMPIMFPIILYATHAFSAGSHDTVHYDMLASKIRLSFSLNDLASVLHNKSIH